MSQKQTTPDDELNTEIHSIKRQAERKCRGELTKFHYRRVERNNDKFRRAKSDKSRSKTDTDRLSTTPHAQSNSYIYILVEGKRGRTTSDD